MRCSKHILYHDDRSGTRSSLLNDHCSKFTQSLFLMGKDPLSTGSDTPENGTKKIGSETLEPRPVAQNMKDSDSDGDTATNSEKFDWSEEGPSEPEPSLRATRGRWLWMALMKLAMPVRVFLI